SRSDSPCPAAFVRCLFSPRCNVLSAKPWLLQNSTCRSPLDSNSVTRRLISWLLRRFRTLTSSLSLMRRVDQNQPGVPRWVGLTDRMYRHCIVCGRPFRVWRCELQRNRAKFCTRGCYYEAWREFSEALANDRLRLILRGNPLSPEPLRAKSAPGEAGA